MGVVLQHPAPHSGWVKSLASETKYRHCTRGIQHRVTVENVLLFMRASSASKPLLLGKVH